MKFIELTVRTTTEASELVADAMWEYSNFGVAVSDFADVVALRRESTVFWDYMDETVSSPRADVLVKCYVEPSRAEEASRELMRELFKRRELAAGMIDFGTLEETKREVEGDDWIDVWKKHFRPIPVGERIVVVPEWIGYETKGKEVAVRLDSNMAFGTGEHETTRMCLEFLQRYLKEGAVVLDVGCGSGILGIAAAKLGAGECLLSDLDPVAVESAAHNIRLNGVSDRANVFQANLLEGETRQADLILANITAEVLALLAPSVSAALKEGGTLILSGIIRERLDFVKEIYRREGFTLLEEKREGEWHALVCRK